MTELAKTFEPGAIEARWYAHWESEGLFRPDRPDETPFTIVMPPPNVTGRLHIGHALDITLQDILIRHARMQGKDALWVVGTDHAGIATQMVVERQLDAEQKKRTDFTRDEFVAKVWEWKAESGGAITQQLRRLGASCDWANERFTMDEGFSKAVTHVFVELHKRGLLYRDKRLVNWDPHFQTAISDLEVETRDTAGKFWTLRYPLADGSGLVEVATTRPETMLADMAVAVHPEDARYTALVGKTIRLPITGREIPIITDEHADPELGSGAVKITPGHDFNDYEVGKRAGFKPGDMLNMFDGAGRVVQCGGIPEELLGLDRFDARKRVVDLLDAAGALVKVEDRQIATPYGDRSGVVIEPWLTDQWYVDAATLAKPAIEAVRSGAIKIVPETWAKTWFNWLENIQPWCVSRQLWWGHRIPAYFGPNPEHFGRRLSEMPDGQMLPELLFVGEDHDAVRRQAFQRYESQGVSLSDIVIHDNIDSWAAAVGQSSKINILRDQDVLDTWFSSALWPFATLGWPVENPPRNGEGATARAVTHVKHGGGAVLDTTDADGGKRPLHQPSAGPPPRSGEELSRHYPNDVLISGFDILFFWDARMAMQGIEFMGRGGELPLDQSVPWKTLYLHGLVRDANGQKMSKSKGNTVDPLGLIDRFGADALRFTMAAMESQGRDIKLDEKRVEGYRNFATKLWNAARFLQGNGVRASTSIAAPPATLPVNRWIIGEVVATLDAMNKAIAELRFDGMADAIYHFTWGTFCDWYVELIKGEFGPSPSGEGKSAQREGAGDVAETDRPHPNPSPQGEGLDETRAVAAWAFDQILVMLHPLMPFITEELWHSMGERKRDLIVAKWPEPEATADTGADAEIEWLIRFIKEVRATRTALNIPPAAMLEVSIWYEGELQSQWRRTYRDSIRRLCRIGNFKNLDAAGSSENAAQFVVDGATYMLGLEGVIDLGAERARLSKAIAVAAKDRDGLAARLANPAFAERAKPEAVAKAREDHDARAAEAERLAAALSRLG